MHLRRPLLYCIQSTVVVSWAVFGPSGEKLGSITFGLYNHLVVSGADHVFGQPHGAWSTVFVVTAYPSFLTEAIGTYADLYFLCERHPRLWNRRFNSVDLELFLSESSALAVCRGLPMQNVNPGH